VALGRVLCDQSEGELVLEPADLAPVRLERLAGRVGGPQALTLADETLDAARKLFNAGLVLKEYSHVSLTYRLKIVQD
jgi:hypothetical protein